MSNDISDKLVVVDGVRTPFCKIGSELADFSAVELGRIVVDALLVQTGIDKELIDEVIIGCVAQPPEAANLARVIALQAGISEKTPAVTVHRNCASGLEAITQAYEKMSAGRGDVFIVGGTESMSNVPFYYQPSAVKKFSQLSRARNLWQKINAIAAFKPRDFSPRVGLKMGLHDPVSGLNMGETAEVLARDFSITRKEQDSFALRSHQNAESGEAARNEEIIPVYLPRGKKSVIQEDNGIRENQSLEALQKLKPVFERGSGTVTAGNASQITDGAVALLVMRQSTAEKLGCETLGILEEYVYTGCEPKRMGLGPAYALSQLENKIDGSIHDADIVEINEAFAAQVIAVQRALNSEAFCRKELGRDTPIGSVKAEKLNRNGGAIALGHPVGATGARLVLSALKTLQRNNQDSALISLCVGGGQGAALWFKRS